MTRAVTSLRANSIVAMVCIASMGVGRAVERDWGWMTVNVMGFLITLGIHKSAKRLIREYQAETVPADLMDQAIRDILRKDGQ